MLTLNPDVKLRPDGGRAILFSIQRPDSPLQDIFVWLYPQQAVLLSLFDGRRSLARVRRDASYLFDLSAEQAQEALDVLLDLPVGARRVLADLMTPAAAVPEGKRRVYDPGQFIVPADQVDMSGVRCHMPCSLLILSTLRCYANCRYCYADRHRPEARREFDAAFFDDLLAQMQQLGIETVELSGGDLFCREDAFELISCILGRGMHASIPTKYPLDRGQVRRLADLGLDGIQISLDSDRPEVLQWLIRMPDYGRRILRTVDLLAEYGVCLRTNSVLTPRNLPHALDFARFLAGLEHTTRINFTCYSRSLYGHDDGLFCPRDQVLEFERGFDRLKAQHPDKLMSFSGPLADPYAEGDQERRADAWDQRAFCTANRRAFAVLPDGRATVCEELYFHPHFLMGDLKRQSILEVWRSPRALELARPSQESLPDGACRLCPDFRKCRDGLGYCPREAMKAYGLDLPHWPDPRCPRAPRGQRLA